MHAGPASKNKKNERDNDGGLIRPDGLKKAGFLAQLDGSFSPDGYFTEGPYYLRYAIWSVFWLYILQNSTACFKTL